MKLMVGIPCYDGKVFCDTVRSLLEEVGAASLLGVQIDVRFIPGTCYIPLARNRIVDDFLASDADKLVFIDADVSWPVGSLLKLASHGVDCVAGVYRHKRAEETYPLVWPDESGTVALQAVDGLLEARFVPAGFWCLTRAAFETFRAFHGERPYSHEGNPGYAWFSNPYRPGALWGEDTLFCEEYREAGGRVWVDPELTLTHTGSNPAFTGCLGDFLRGRIDDNAG